LDVDQAGVAPARSRRARAAIAAPVVDRKRHSRTRLSSDRRAAIDRARRRSFRLRSPGPKKPAEDRDARMERRKNAGAPRLLGTQLDSLRKTQFSGPTRH